MSVPSARELEEEKGDMCVKGASLGVRQSLPWFRKRVTEDKATRVTEDKATRVTEGKVKRVTEDKANRVTEDKANRVTEDKAEIAGPPSPRPNRACRSYRTREYFRTIKQPTATLPGPPAGDPLRGQPTPRRSARRTSKQAIVDSGGPV